MNSMGRAIPIQIERRDPSSGISAPGHQVRENDHCFMFSIDVSHHHPHKVMVEIRGSRLLVSVGEWNSNMTVYEAELAAPFDLTAATAGIANGTLEIQIPKATLWKQISIDYRDEKAEPDPSDDLEECDID